MQSGLRDFVLHFQAGQIQNIVATGDFFGVLESENDLYFSIDNGPFIKRKAGHYQKGDFETLAVKSLVVQSAVVIAGLGDFNSTVVTTVVSATVEPGNATPALNDVVIPAGNSAVVAIANGTRKHLVIKALYNNPPDVFIRLGAAPAAGKGIELGASEAIQLETEGAISAFNPGGADFTVSVMEVNRV